MSCIKEVELVTVPLGELEKASLTEDTFAFESLAPVGAWTQLTGVTLNGYLFAGSYAHVLSELAQVKDQVHGLVVMLSHGQGMEAFLDEVGSILGPVSVAGGAAARAELDGQGMIFPQGEDVTVLGLTDSGWKSGTVLFHKSLEKEIRVLGDEPRSFDQLEIDGNQVSAFQYFNELAEAQGLGDRVWDLVALLGEDERLLHLSTDGERVMVSANLPASRKVKMAIYDEAYGLQQMNALKPEQLLLFGCAGLNGLIQGERQWEGLYPSCYIYGEIVQPDGVAGFANLSMSMLYRD